MGDMGLFEHVSWLDINNFEIQLSYQDDFRNVFIEAPAINVNLEYVKKLWRCIVGRNTGIDPTVMIHSNTIIGRYCSIGGYVQISPISHTTQFLSTGNIDETKSSSMVSITDESSKKVTQIGCDVWIGGNVVIMRGVTVGHGACIGAGAIVTKDVPPYSIVVGTPAKVLKYRFPKRIIEDLLELQWWTMEPDVIKTLPYQDIEKCVSILKEKRGDTYLPGKDFTV